MKEFEAFHDKFAGAIDIKPADQSHADHESLGQPKRRDPFQGD